MEFNDRREGKVIQVAFGSRLGGKTCPTCKGYGRIRGETVPHPSGIGQSTPTWRCKNCNGLGETFDAR